MRILMILLITAVLLAAFAGAAYPQGKTAVDPNTVAKATDADEPTQKPDERLATKISYFSGYSRLSDAISQISKLSQISISTGQSRSDWQVRDLPVVVCANDIGVGQLLKLIADAYYLTLSRSDADGVPTYRLTRPKMDQDVINTYNNECTNYPFRHANFEWQTYKYAGSLSPKEAEELYQKVIKKNPDFGIAYRSDSSDSRLAMDEIVMYGKLINSIDQASYAKMMNGQEITLRAQQGGDIGKLVMDFARLKQKIVRAMRYNARSDTGDFFDESDIASAQVKFRMDQTFGFALRGNLEAGREILTGFNGDIQSFARAAASAGVEPLAKVLPSNPPTPSLQQMKCLKLISKDEELLPKGKFDFEKPSAEQLLLADVLTEVSKKTGYSIIADDYCDHLDNPGIAADSIFSAKMSMVDVKNSLGREYKWYIRADDKTLAVKHRYSVDRYADLVPKSLFADWLRKADSSGLDLTDYLAAWRLTNGQRADWIKGVEALSGLDFNGLSDPQQFQLNVLSSLSQSDLDAAQTGLPVARIGTDVFARFFNSLPAETRPKDDVAQLTLRLTREEQADSKHYTYSLSILGKQTNMKIPLKLMFPIYSPDREKELGKPTKK